MYFYSAWNCNVQKDYFIHILGPYLSGLCGTKCCLCLCSLIRIIYVEAPMQLRFWLTIIVHFYSSVLSVT